MSDSCAFLSFLQGTLLTAAKVLAKNKFDRSVRYLQEQFVPSLFSPSGAIHSVHQVLGKMGLTNDNGQSRKCNHVPATIM
jgi:hypothetical protein